jgi:SAM-dependent methyltransferase
MMAYMDQPTTAIEDMPRGGFDASWLDRLLQTDRPEYLDGDDDDLKRRVVRSLEVVGDFFHLHQRFAQIALAEIADVADPRILELGSGHGGLSQAILQAHPAARLTVTDVEPTSVAGIAAGELGRHPRAVVLEMDATAIDAPDRSFDLAVFALSFHHLPPALAARVFAEGTRVARKLLIIDLHRPSSPLHLVRLATMLPLAPLVPFVHDGVISSLRAYGPSALLALARHADPAIEVELRSGGFGGPFQGPPQIAVAQRAG